MTKDNLNNEIHGLSLEELEAQETIELPNREALSLLDPSSLASSYLGGSGTLPTTSAPTTTPNAATTAQSYAHAPDLSSVPVPGSYSPIQSASATS